jgi:DNA-directed RNA polymerase subunit beta
MAERLYFGKLKEVAEPPNLIEVQVNSYVEFLQKDVPASKRKNTGLQTVFREVFPIESYDNKATLDFSHYDIGEPKLTALEAQREGQTYSAPLHVTFLLKEEGAHASFDAAVKERDATFEVLRSGFDCALPAFRL